MADRPEDGVNGTTDARRSPRETSLLFWTLVVVGLVLAVAVVPGVFIIDEPNYLATVVARQHGSWMLAGTAGLAPSRELAAFDPEDQSRSITATPVTSLAPPLYAFLALPFSWFGWTALFLMNVLAFVLTAWCVYTLVREQGGSAAAASIGCAFFALGGFSIEYALGMWPHMVSVALTTAALLAFTRSLDRRSAALAFAAGLLAATAVGVREQTIVLAGGLGGAMLTFARPRWRLTAGFVAGAALPLLVIASINAGRLGVFHPIPKLGAYASDVRTTTAPAETTPGGPAAVMWAKVVDFRTHPPFTDPLKERLFHKEPETGVPIVGIGVVKKALLQSAPWAALAIALLLVGWHRPSNGTAIPRALLGVSAWMVVPLVAVIAAAGFGRSDGFAYNQRYFLELVPVLATLAGLAVGRNGNGSGVAGGVVISIVGSAVIFALTSTPARYAVIATVPLILAAASFGAGLVSVLRRGRVLVAVVLGLALGWSAFIHIVEDVRASRDRRSANLEVLRAIEPVVPDGAALFTYWGSRDAVGPLMMTRNVVLLDAWADDGASAPALVSTLLDRGQRVVVRADGFPSPLLSQMADGRRLDTLRSTFPKMIEIVRPS